MRICVIEHEPATQLRPFRFQVKSMESSGNPHEDVDVLRAIAVAAGTLLKENKLNPEALRKAHVARIYLEAGEGRKEIELFRSSDS